MILFSILIGTCRFLRYAERSRSVRCGYLEMSSYRTLRLRSAYERSPIQIFLIYFNREEIFYFKMMKGYKIGGRGFISKALQQLRELPVTPEQKRFSLLLK
jgi:hypothetical protein